MPPCGRLRAGECSRDKGAASIGRKRLPTKHTLNSVSLGHKLMSRRHFLVAPASRCRLVRRPRSSASLSVTAVCADAAERSSARAASRRRRRASPLAAPCSSRFGLAAPRQLIASLTIAPNMLPALRQSACSSARPAAARPRPRAPAARTRSRLQEIHRARRAAPGDPVALGGHGSALLAQREHGRADLVRRRAQRVVDERGVPRRRRRRLRAPTARRSAPGCALPWPAEQHANAADHGCAGR